MSSRLTYVCASLKLRANVATNICSADASRAIGAAASAISNTWRPPRLSCMPSCSSGTKRSMRRLNTSVSSEATRPNTHVAEPLAGGQGRPRHRIDQQRLERPALPLAGGRVDRHVEPSDERGHDQEHRQPGEQPRPRLRRGREIQIVDPDCLDDAGVNAAGDQAQRSHLAAVFEEQPAGAPNVRERRRPRAVVDDAHDGRPDRPELLAVFLVYHQDEVHVAVAHGRLGVGRRVDDDDAALLQPGDQIGGVLTAGNRRLEGPIGTLLPRQRAEHHREHERHQDRIQQRRH